MFLIMLIYVCQFNRSIVTTHVRRHLQLLHEITNDTI